MTVSSLNIRPNWRIVLRSEHPVAQLAATELRRTLQRIGAPPLPIEERVVSPCIALEHGDDGDGFERTAGESGIRIVGAGPRGLLYGVYDLLEALGCRWVQPGYAGEALPRYERIELPADTLAQQPALLGRSLIIGHDFVLRDAEDWIVWAARNRLNSIFIHTVDSHGASGHISDSQALAALLMRPYTLGACQLSSWQQARGKLLPLLHERGMIIELGGHGMRALVPRGLFADVPEAFRHNGSERTPDHNFCPTSSEAQALLQRNGRAFFVANPEADVYHLWPDDIPGAGWCHCERCAALSPSDQALLATNILADTLAAVKPSARIAYLAYHDTLPAPTTVRPQPNVVLTFAPRARSYGDAFGDATNTVNQQQSRALAANQSWFSQSAGQSASETRIFDYYLDALLFKSAVPPLFDTLADDLSAYRDAGAHTVQVLATSDRPWLVPPINGYLFARLAWNPEQPVAALLATYAAARAPAAADSLAAAYNALAAAWRPALSLTPGEITQPQPQTDGNAAVEDGVAAAPLLRHDPPADLLDYMDAPKALRERRLALIDRTLPLLDTGRAAWQRILVTATVSKTSLEREYQEWELAALQLAFVSKRQRLFVLAGRSASRPVLRAALVEARTALDALRAWGQTNLDDPQARASFALLRELHQLQLDALEGRAVVGAVGRGRLRIAAYQRLGTLLARLKAARFAFGKKR